MKEEKKEKEKEKRIKKLLTEICKKEDMTFVFAYRSDEKHMIAGFLGNADKHVLNSLKKALNGAVEEFIKELKADLLIGS